MSGDHLERLEAFLDAWPDKPVPGLEEADLIAEGVMAGDPDLYASDLRAALDELKQGRAERDGETAERCRAMTNTRLNLQCDRSEGHDVAHVAELAGMGRISWHGVVPQPPAQDGKACYPECREAHAGQPH